MGSGWRVSPGRLAPPCSSPRLPIARSPLPLVSVVMNVTDQPESPKTEDSAASPTYPSPLWLDRTSVSIGSPGFPLREQWVNPLILSSLGVTQCGVTKGDGSGLNLFLSALDLMSRTMTNRHPVAPIGLSNGNPRLPTPPTHKRGREWLGVVLDDQRFH
jgi:hypothetical protein